MSKRITAEQLNAFVILAVEVLEKLARISSQVGTLRRQQWVILPEMPGDLNGKVVFQFDPPVLKQILASLLGKPVPPLADPICCDALGELANIICGNATGRLEALGLRTTITPPQVLAGGELTRRMNEKEGIVIPIQSSLGEILEKA